MALTLVVTDTFTEASTIALGSHTSDSGHGWNVWNGGIQVNGTSNKAEETNYSSGNRANCTRNNSVAEYDVLGTISGAGGFDHSWRTSGVDRSSPVGEFSVPNEELFYDGTGPSAAGQNAGRKHMLMTRYPGSLGGAGRYDIIWNGSATTGTAGTGTVSISYNAGTDTGTATFSSSQTLTAGQLIRVGPSTNQHLYEIVSGSGTSYTIKGRFIKTRMATSLTGQSFWITEKRYINAQFNSNPNASIPLMPNTPVSVGQNLGTTAFRMENAQNQINTFTQYIKASSTETATDGIMRLWANGELVLEATNLGYGNYPFDTIEIFGGTYNSPRLNQTEYFWDLVIWKP